MEANEKISEKAGKGNAAKRAKPAAGTAVALAGVGAVMGAIDFSKVKVVRAVATPTLSMKGDNIELFIKITSPIVAGNPDKDTGKPIFGCKVIDLTDGIEKAVVTPAVVRSELTTTYPNDAYVGKAFALKKEGKAAGKRYNMWQIVEIDISAAQAVEA